VSGSKQSTHDDERHRPSLNPRSHAQVTPFYQVRTTQEPVYQALGNPGHVVLSPLGRGGAASRPWRLLTNLDKCPFMKCQPIR
jgi:hypothetical protein